MTRPYQVAYLILCLMVGTAVWMMAYAAILQLFYKDARLLHIMITTNPFAPIQQIWLYANNRHLQAVAVGALLPAAMIAFLVGRLAMRTPSNPLGDAAFQDPASLRRGKWLRKDGHILGRFGRRILRRKDDRHHLIIGPTRSGKGVGYVIPNALMHEGSMVVTDLKGEIYQATAAYRKQAGHQVFQFSPGSVRTHRWNPLDFVRSDRGSRTIDIQNIASILIPEMNGSDNAVWQGTAQQVIGGVISYVLESQYYRNHRTLGDVNAVFSCGMDLQILMKLILEKEPDLSRFTKDSFNAYISLNERAARSALLDIQKAMQPFRNERVVAATSVTDIDLKSMQRRPVSVYLAPNITDVTILRPVLTLFVQQIMDLLTRQHDVSALPVYFLLDEFRQLKRMDEIMNKLPYVAGYNIKMAFIIQDLKNLDEIYGETARHSMLGNCGLQLILGANDQATAEYASRALGKKTIRYKSESRTLALMGFPRRTKVEQIRERDLLMPQEIRQLPEDRLVMLVEGQKPILAQKFKYYEEKLFKKAVEQSQQNAPEVPEPEEIAAVQVPATKGNYGEPNAEVAPLQAHVEPAQTDDLAPAPDQVARSLDADKQPGTHPARQKSEKPKQKKASLRSQEIVEIEIERSAAELKSLIDQAVSDPQISVARRLSIEEIMRKTVPDPDDLTPQLAGNVA